MEDKELSYEQAVVKFDQHLKALEEGKLSLEEALDVVEQASHCLRTAKSRLEEARQRIEVRPLEGKSSDSQDSEEGASGSQLPQQTTVF